jgi:hypothetical protein
VAAEWWTLPGPARLIASVSLELRRGRNVILGAPPDLAEGFRSELRSSLDEGMRWQSLTIDPSLTPLDFLWEQFVMDEHAGDRRSIDDLARRSEMSNGVVWLDGFELDAWSRWRDFVMRYSHAVANLPVLHRMLLCCRVPLSAAPGLDSDVCCASVNCLGYADPLDALTYSASQIGPASGKRALDVEVRASVTAALALWDPGLCNMLIEESVASLFAPDLVISTWAQARGWSPDWDDHELRSRGLLCPFNGGEERLHAGIHALRNDTREIQLRVWRGQVGVLLPFIEERRRDLLQALDAWLALPFQSDRGEIITDASDLELGHLRHMFASDRRIGIECWRLIEVLREMRNGLAHFAPVSGDQLHAPELLDYRRILDRVRPGPRFTRAIASGR